MDLGRDEGHGLPGAVLLQALADADDGSEAVRQRRPQLAVDRGVGLAEILPAL